jgi:predicted nucleic acid-binding protein
LQRFVVPLSSSQYEIYHEAGIGCRSATLARTLDIIHVAAALEIGCEQFVSFDKRQRNVAVRERLKIIPRSI